MEISLNSIYKKQPFYIFALFSISIFPSAPVLQYFIVNLLQHDNYYTVTDENNASIVVWKLRHFAANTQMTVFKKVQGNVTNVASNRMGMKFRRNVLQVNTHRLTESHFRFHVTLSRCRPWRHWSFHAEKCLPSCELSAHAASAR